MTKNIIQILKSGNVEMFYSSFIGWLLDQNGEHGLNDQFTNWFLKRIGEVPQKIEIETEQNIEVGRVDIVIRTNTNRKILVENKTKSIGSSEQVERYAKAAPVVCLGFVKENFPREFRENVIAYKEIIDFLKTAVKARQPLAVLVDHFISFLDAALTPFDTFDRYCKDEININQAISGLESYPEMFQNDNDQRFFQAIYFERLQSYLADNIPKLIFGNSGYYDQKRDPVKPDATKWIIEKNVPGLVYMESIIYSQSISGKIKIAKDWEDALLSAKNPDLSPRIELWTGPKGLFKQEIVGVFEIGCWDEELKKSFIESKKFNYRGPRNFHYKFLKVEDLKYSHMGEIMIEEMSKVWNFQTDV